MRGKLLVGFICVLTSVVFAVPKNYYQKNVGSPAELSKLLSSIDESPGKFLTVESTLKWFSENYPDQMSYFTLVHLSHSLQAASILDPRAVVYGPDASVVFTFNGHASQKGFDTIELFEKKPGKPYRFKEIVFTFHGAVVSEDNPAKCMRCHRSELRGIWAPYEVWDGVYGKFDDAIANFDEKRYAGRDLGPTEKEQRQELSNYLAFQKHRAQHPRYQYLNFPAEPEDNEKESEYLVSPYAPRTRFSSDRYRPNLTLTHLLADQNADRLVALMKKDDACFDGWGRVLLASLLKCDRSEMKDFAALAEKKVKARFEPMALLPWSKDYPSLHAPYFALLGVDAGDLSLKLDPKNWVYFVGQPYAENVVINHLYPAVSKRTPGMYSFQTYNSVMTLIEYHGEDGDENDKQREAESERVFREKAKVCEVILKPVENLPLEGLCAAPKLPEKTPPVVSMCLSCHDSGEGGAPRIAFDDSFRGRILERIETTDEKKRMPPARSLTIHEKEMIRLYLRK